MIGVWAPGPTESKVTGRTRSTRAPHWCGARHRLLLDDHEIVRRGLRELIELEDDLTVISEAGTAEEALRRIPPTRPDVALLDMRLPDGDGIEVCRDIRASRPETKCIMLTSFADDEAVQAAVLAGASGYLLKQVRGNEIVEGIRRVAAGQSLLDPTLVAKAIERLQRSPDEDELAHLTPQERRILVLIAEGLTNRQIGDQMFLAEKTVKNYVSNLLSKLGMSRRTEAAVYATKLAGRKRGARPADS